jgi:hypothetical protein
MNYKSDLKVLDGINGSKLSYLVNELQHQRMMVAMQTPHIFCQFFKDNEAALEISRVPKIQPYTQHIIVIYHHFRSEVFNGSVKVQPSDP